eukprot:13852-Pelagococcus_subviridis.AAC.5
MGPYGNHSEVVLSNLRMRFKPLPDRASRSNRPELLLTDRGADRNSGYKSAAALERQRQSNTAERSSGWSDKTLSERGARLARGAVVSHGVRRRGRAREGGVRQGAEGGDDDVDAVLEVRRARDRDRRRDDREHSVPPRLRR